MIQWCMCDGIYNSMFNRTCNGGRYNVLNLQELCAGGVTWEVTALPPLGQELGIFP